MKNISYLTKQESAQYYECNFSCDNAFLLKLNKDKYFITDSRYTIEAKEETSNTKVIEAQKGDLLQTAINIMLKNKAKSLVFDPAELSYKDINRLQDEKKISLMPELNFAHKLREIKTQKEIDYIAKSQKLNKKAFKKFADFLSEQGEGKNEKELSFVAESFLRDFGKRELSFKPILGIESNAAKPHALPTNKKLKINNLLLFDAGIKYKRYCSDRTRTAIFDKNGIKFSKNQKFNDGLKQKIYDTVLKAQQKAIEEARVGMRAQQLDLIAREVIQKSGFGKYFSHSLGHGVGLDVHEYPIISSKSQSILKENMVLTIEPGVYIPNEFGVRIEEIIVMGSKKAKIL